MISPYANRYSDLRFSYQLGGIISYGFSDNASILLGVRYSMRHGPAVLNRSTKVIENENQLAGLSSDFIVRYRFLPGLALDLGACGWVPRLTVSAEPGKRKISEMEYYYGVCGGLMINLIQTPGFSINAIPRYSAYDLHGEVVENLTGGIELLF